MSSNSACWKGAALVGPPEPVARRTVSLGLAFPSNTNSSQTLGQKVQTKLKDSTGKHTPGLPRPSTGSPETAQGRAPPAASQSSSVRGAPDPPQPSSPPGPSPWTSLSPVLLSLLSHPLSRQRPPLRTQGPRADSPSAPSAPPGAVQEAPWGGGREPKGA